ncbi:DnaT-like ssDNA-binding protein [Chelativorans sp.]|uniref:DnaT-like ssDNA-binding protein n=1 Tax=Chelativorans sp. TaxID=2203393 RepID=UPI00281169F1|nr:DnaT-like ssDNA-binding protein [Chelativorans sp.]
MAGYGTDEGFTAYVAAAGYTVPSGANITAARQRGSVYIDGFYGSRFPGIPTGGLAQERAWPRTGAVDAYGNVIAPHVIPQQVVNASYEAAFLEITRPGSLSLTVDPSRQIKRQKVEGIEREFFEPAARGGFFAPNAPISSIIEGILAPLLGSAAPLPAILVV